MWGPDGFVYFRTPKEWLEVPPPSRWKPAVGFVPRPAKAIDTEPGPTVHIRAPDSQRAYDIVCPGTFRQDVRMVIVIDALPDGSRTLVHVYQDTSSVMMVVDGDGQIILDLDGAGLRFQPVALSSDGRLIVGFNTDMEREGIEGFNHSWLEAADALGRWRTKIAGGSDGENPQMSREGSFIAFTAGRGTTIGRLIVEGPARE